MTSPITIHGHHSFSPEFPEDETVCRYWAARGAIESDRNHVMQGYQPKGSPVWIHNCMYCGWVDGEDLARQIAALPAVSPEVAEGEKELENR